MGYLKPVEMTKVGVVGLKADQERILSVVHDLGVLQVEPVAKETLHYLQPERASETQRLVGEQYIRFKGLKTALPRVPSPHRGQYGSLDEVMAATRGIPIDDEVGRLKRAEDAAISRRKHLEDTIALLQKNAYYTDRLEYLSGQRVLAFFGEAKPAVYATLRKEIPALADAQFLDREVGGKARFLVVVRHEQAEAIGRLAQQRGVALTPVPELTGTIAEAIPELQRELTSLDAQLAQVTASLAAIATEWYGRVAAIEEGLAIEARKLDVYVRLGAGASTFAVEGWIPTRELEPLQHAVEAVSGGRTAVYEAPAHEEEPTLMDNPKGVRWFEFFIKFYSIPQATEFDPTWIFAIAFSVFFGFMVADWGFGLTILLVCIWMILNFPGGRYLPKGIKGFITTIMGPQGMRALALTLVPGCLIAIGLGLWANEFFGGSLGGYAGYDLSRNVSFLLGISLLFGLILVDLGFLLGAIHENYKHHRRASIAKIGGAIAALGVYGLFSPILAAGANLAPTGSIWLYVWFVAFAGGAATLVAGEGVMLGMIGTLETLTHVLSYARLVGILLASIILTAFIVSGADGLIAAGGVSIAIGIALLLFGVGFTVILAVFEPSIQGMRLMFVEHFSKYYEGNGRPFTPFGSDRVHTVPSGLPTPAPASGAAPSASG